MLADRTAIESPHEDQPAEKDNGPQYLMAKCKQKNINTQEKKGACLQQLQILDHSHISHPFCISMIQCFGSLFNTPFYKMTEGFQNQVLSWVRKNKTLPEKGAFYFYMTCRPSRALDNVTSSANSSWEPTGTP